MPIMSRNQNGSYDEIPATTDQVYSSTSKNPQSGVAVAQAIAASETGDGKFKYLGMVLGNFEVKWVVGGNDSFIKVFEGTVDLSSLEGYDWTKPKFLYIPGIFPMTYVFGPSSVTIRYLKYSSSGAIGDTDQEAVCIYTGV